MFVRRLLAVAAVACGLITAPAVSSIAAPSGGCPYPPNNPVLTLDASPTWITEGQSSTIAGQFSQNGCAIVGARIAVETKNMVHDHPVGHWHIWRWLTTDTNGQFSTVLTPAHDTLLRAVSQGTSQFPTTISNYVAVHVQIAVSMLGYHKPKCAIEFKGDINPPYNHRRIYVQNRGPQGQFNGWTTLWSSTTDKHGHYDTTHTLSCSTVYNISVEAAGDSRTHTGRSRTIFDIKPTH